MISKTFGGGRGRKGNLQERAHLNGVPEITIRENNKEEREVGRIGRKTRFPPKTSERASNNNQSLSDTGGERRRLPTRTEEKKKRAKKRKYLDDT